jgi:hypothetical protein
MSDPRPHNVCLVLDEFVGLVLDEFVGPAAADKGDVTPPGSRGTIVQCTVLEEFVGGTPATSETPPANSEGHIAELATQVARQYGIPPATALELVQYILEQVPPGLRGQA